MSDKTVESDEAVALFDRIKAKWKVTDDELAKAIRRNRNWVQNIKRGQTRMQVTDYALLEKVYFGKEVDVSRFLDSSLHNVLHIAEGGEYEVTMFNIAQMIIRSTTFQLTDTLPLLAMCCYTLFVLISCALAKII